VTGIVKIWLGWNPVIEEAEKQRSPGARDNIKAA